MVKNHRTLSPILNHRFKESKYNAKRQLILPFLFSYSVSKTLREQKMQLFTRVARNDIG